jgi:phage tail-like protein
MAFDYPPVAFHFVVSLDGAPTDSKWPDADASFQEVSGIRVQFGSEDVAEGGMNQFVHRLPKPPTYSNLVLKRGVVVAPSALATWVSATLGSMLSSPIRLRDLYVFLRNENGNPLIMWKFVNAYPVVWDTSPLNAMESTVLTETMEFSYNFFERKIIDRRPSPPSDPPGRPRERGAAAAGLR